MRLFEKNVFMVRLFKKNLTIKNWMGRSHPKRKTYPRRYRIVRGSQQKLTNKTLAPNFFSFSFFSLSRHYDATTGDFFPAPHATTVWTLVSLTNVGASHGVIILLITDSSNYVALSMYEILPSIVGSPFIQPSRSNRFSVPLPLLSL